MKDRWVRGLGVIALGVVAPVLSVGCDNTAVKVADVPPAAPSSPEVPKQQAGRIPKNATFSPPVLPGNGAQ